MLPLVVHQNYNKSSALGPRYRSPGRYTKHPRGDLLTADRKAAPILLILAENIFQIFLGESLPFNERTREEFLVLADSRSAQTS